MATFALVAVASLAYLLIDDHHESQNWFIVTNLSGVEITDVHVRVPAETGSAIDVRIGSIPAGGTAAFPTRTGDTSTEISFDLAGRRIRDGWGYVDLWAGDDWEFTVRPDGVVEQSYGFR